jgi:hypothetical protein
VKHRILQCKNLTKMEILNSEECEELFLNLVDFSLSFSNYRSECNHLDYSKHMSGFVKQFCLGFWFFRSNLHHCALLDVPSRVIDRSYCNLISRLSNNLLCIAISCENITKLNHLLFKTYNNRNFDDRCKSEAESTSHQMLFRGWISEWNQIQFDPSNQFIQRVNFLVCNLLLDMAEEKEIRQCQIRREDTWYPRNPYLNYFLIITHQ